MNDTTKAKIGPIYIAFLSAVLSVSIYFLSWTANAVVEQGKQMAAQETQIRVNTGRLAEIEGHGSKNFSAHESMDDKREQKTDKMFDLTDKRMERLESAVIVLQTAPGELKAMNVELKNLRDGQTRIEKILDEIILKQQRP